MGLCLPPGQGVSLCSCHQGLFCCLPPAASPVSYCSCTLAVKLTCFLSVGYLESKAVVVIEICGWSDALLLLLWDGGGKQQ